MGALQSHDQQHTKHGKEIVIYSFKKFPYINYGRDPLHEFQKYLIRFTYLAFSVFC